jgi:hypothetical protein
MKKLILLFSVGFFVYSCTKTDYCPSLGLNYGDPCKTISGKNGVVDSNCVCFTGIDTTSNNNGGSGSNKGVDSTSNNNGGSGSNKGVDSTSNNNGGSGSTVTVRKNCPSLGLYVGDSCKKSNNTYGVVDSTCFCK